MGASGAAPAADRHHRRARARPAWYTVAAVAAVDDHDQPVERADRGDARRPTVTRSCRVTVDAADAAGPLDRPWRPMIGAERLSQLDHGVGPGGRHIGDEFAEALRMAHDELGVRAVRAHAILHDDLGVYREVDGSPVHDFSGIDRIYDKVMELGLRPIVEVSFMPRDLARDPEQTVFALPGDHLAAQGLDPLGGARRRPRRPPRRSLRA